MTAYELADELKQCIDDGYTDLYCVCHAANMLRQQADRILELDVNLKAQIKLAYERQDRIAELEKDLALKTRDRDVFKNFTLAYEERIAELKKELKRTKFAWNLAENEIETLKYEKSSGVYDLAKTLTDEEIQAIAKESYVWNTGKQEWSEIEFARAILRKAQEK